MATLQIGALQWRLYSPDTPDLVAPYLVDFTQYGAYAFAPRGAQALLTTGSVKAADGVVIDNMTNGADVTAVVGAITEFIPRYQKVTLMLPGVSAPDVILSASAGTTRVTFFTGTYHGTGSNINGYQSNKAGAVATVTDGTIDAYFNSLRWKINFNLAAGFNLDNITDSGFYDVLNPTNSSTALPAGTWYVEHHTYSSSNLYAFQIARNLISPDTQTYERRLLGGSGWTAWVQASNNLPLFLSANTQLTPASSGADIFASGTIGITLPANASVGYKTGTVLNDGTGTVTIAPPSGFTLDGSTSVPIYLFPGQSARFIQTGAMAFRTIWIVQRPVISISAVAIAASFLTLPVGYKAFNIALSNVTLSVNGTSFYGRFSFDGGATYKSGATDYTNSNIALIGSTMSTGSSQNSAAFFTVASISNGVSLSARATIHPGDNTALAAVDMDLGFNSGGAYAQSNLKNVINAASGRMTNFMIAPGSGTFTGLISMEMQP